MNGDGFALLGSGNHGIIGACTGPDIDAATGDGGIAGAAGVGGAAGGGAESHIFHADPALIGAAPAIAGFQNGDAVTKGVGADLIAIDAGGGADIQGVGIDGAHLGVGGSGAGTGTGDGVDGVVTGRLRGAGGGLIGIGVCRGGIVVVVQGNVAHVQHIHNDPAHDIQGIGADPRPFHFADGLDSKNFQLFACIYLCVDAAAGAG